jgi:ATP-dependent DNA helicase RecG
MLFDFKNTLKNGESETLEFKSSFNREVIETACAFANRNGGTILIGVDDSARIVGVPYSTETAQKWLNEIKQNTSPAIIPDLDAFHADGKTVVAIHVSEFPVKPVACRDRYFKRIANSNHRLNLTEIANLHLQSLQLSWDAYAPEGGSLGSVVERENCTFHETH